MSDTKLVSPLLDGFALGAPMNSHSGVCCCPAMKENSDNKYIVKIISVPAAQVQLDALLLTGAYTDPAAALDYFRQQADDIAAEAEFLQKMSKLEGFLPYEGWQVTPMKKNRLGYHVYLVSDYRRSLEKYMHTSAITHLEAVNLGLDMCDALAMCRRAGYIYVDLKPTNIFLSGDKEYRIGDLGFVSMDFLKYTSMPEKYISTYTAPELKDVMNPLNETVDTYALGMVLYRIFNNGALPALPQDPSLPLSAPCNADPQMAAIILKACAPKNEDRWQDPGEMGKALVEYMQSNTINDVPIAPVLTTPGDEDADTSVTATAEDPADTEKTRRFDPGELTATAAEANAQSQADSQPEAPAVSSETVILNIPVEAAPETAAVEPTAPAEPEAPAAPEVNAEPEVAAPAPEPQPAEPAQKPESAPRAPTRKPSAPKMVPPAMMNAAGAPVGMRSEATAAANSSVSPAAPKQPAAPAAKPAAARPAGAVAVAQKPETKNADAFDLDSELKEVEALLYGSGGTPTATAKPTGSITPTIRNPVNFQSTAVEQPAPKKHIFLKLFVTLLILCLLAAVGYGGYWFYQNYYLQTVESISIKGSEKQMVVELNTDIDDALLSVACADVYGNTIRKNVQNKQAVFTDLKADALYKVTVEIAGLHKLVGQISDVYTTEGQTEIVSFSAVTGQEDGSVLLSLTVHGHEPDEWIVTCTPEEGEEIVHNFTGHSTTVKGLSVSTEYIFRLTASDGTTLMGEDAILFTPTSVIPAENLTVISRSDGKMTLTWSSPEDMRVDTWSVRCYSDNYDETQATAETLITFSGIEDDKAYTIEVTAAGMTQPTRLAVTANPINIKNVRVDESKQDSLKVTWTFDGKAPEGGWLLFYTVDGSKTQEVMKCTEASAVITPRIPTASYDFLIQATDNTSVFNNDYNYVCPDGGLFSSHGISSYKMTTKLLPTPSEEGWLGDKVSSDTFTDKFTSGQKISAVVVVNANFYLNPREDISVMYVIRDAEGKVIYDLIHEEATEWYAMFFDGDYHQCELNIPEVPTEPGEYQLDLYFNHAYVNSTPFSII